MLHSANGNLAIRQGDWVLIDARSDDGNREPDWFKRERNYQTNPFAGELYNLHSYSHRRHKRCQLHSSRFLYQRRRGKD